MPDACRHADYYAFTPDARLIRLISPLRHDAHAFSR